MLKMLLGASVFGASSWLAKDIHLVQGQLADISTATGERRGYTLSDGTQLWLNTGSAVDVRYSAHERRVWVRYGEVHVLTGNDSMLRPLVLRTAGAEFRPLGTRFTVRIDDAHHRTLLSVSSGRVEASLTGTSSKTVIEAGRQVFVDTSGIFHNAPLDSTATAWINGFIIAESQRLGDFVQELARYHQGIMRCDPLVADLRLTGSYPLDNLDQILTMLERSLPVRIQRRTRYWVTITTPV
jgi:transmembrane sensor